jgi:hypothetical protein
MGDVGALTDRRRAGCYPRHQGSDSPHAPQTSPEQASIVEDTIMSDEYLVEDALEADETAEDADLGDGAAEIDVLP